MRKYSTFHCGIATLALLAVLVTGCTSRPTQDEAGERRADPAVMEQVTALLDQAQYKQSPERDQDYLDAARLLVGEGEDDWARNLLVAIDSDTLFEQDFVDYTLLLSRIAIDDDAYFLAQRILTSPRLEQQWTELSEESVIVLRERRAELFALLGESADSVEERINLSRLGLTEQQIADNQNALWRNLMSLSQEQLTERAQAADSRLSRGWYQLAALSKTKEVDIEQQLATIEQWRQDWPDHPASERLPNDLQLLEQMVQNRPQAVSLLLPLSGPYGATGRAVRDGFMAAFYEAKQQGSQVPEIRLFDTHERIIDDVYDLAVSDGADLILGPLLKDNLETLVLRLELPVPTLALNAVASPYGFPDNLYQFGLPVEDEAQQIAEWAWLEGHRNAMTLVSQTDTGQRAADTFIRTWEAQGGQVVQRSYFADQVDYQAVIKESLLVDQSEQRARDLRRLIPTRMHFEEPRRRQDIDLIFMVARPNEARLLKPTLNYHFAGNIPIYATRHIYAGDRQENYSDLNGIRFTVLPWLFDTTSAVKQSVQNNANPSDSYQQFYAMGVDAFRLFPRLRQLAEIPGARFYGATGALELNQQRQVERQQEWMQISNGQPTPLPMVVSDGHME